eukprot:CCRYP_006791-RA/>CCRYP_006791-RA protein AED:0.57 eAED:0.53 QI:0/0/0/1/1/1/2/0/356
MSSPTANEATVYEAVRAIVTPLPLNKIVGQPMTSTVNHLRQQIKNRGSRQNNELGWTPWPSRTRAHRRRVSHGHGQPGHHQQPPPNASGLTNTTTLTNQASITGLHNLACQEFWKQEAVDALIVDKIVREAVDPTYVKELDDDYVGYSGQTIKSIIQHLRTEWCIVTTLEKKQAAQAFHVQWDFTSHITKFARELDKQQKLCRDIGVPAAEATKIQHYVESMYASEMFDDKEMQAWEIKPSADKAWARRRHTSLQSTRARKSLTPSVKLDREGSKAPAVSSTLAAAHPTIHHIFLPPSTPPYHLPTTTHSSSIPTAWRAHWRLPQNTPPPSPWTTPLSSKNSNPNKEPSLTNKLSS